MATITDQDIIDHLKEKINFHQQEIKRLQGALTAFMPQQPAKTKSGSANLKASTAEKAEATPPAEAAPPEPESNPALTIPPKYTDNLGIEAKIAYALNEIKSGFTEDIAGTMAQYEPKSDAKTIGRQISGVLLTLKNEGKLLAEKAGRKEKYSLPAS